MVKGGNDDDEPVWYLQTGFLGAAGFLVMLVVVAGVLVVMGPGPTSSSGVTSSPAAVATMSQTVVTPASTMSGSDIGAAGSAPAIESASTSPAPAPAVDVTDRPADAAAASLCALPTAADSAIPTTPPTAAWRFVGSIAVPVSPRFGPGVEVGAIGNCYVHSPTGALFALVNTLALTEVGSGQISAAAVVEQRGSRSGDYAAALAEAQQQDGRAAMPDDVSTDQRVAVLGYRYVDYTPDRATIAVVMGIGDPNRQATYQPSMLTASVAWEGGDWKFVYSAATARTVAPIVSTEQYTPWSA